MLAYLLGIFVEWRFLAILGNTLLRLGRVGNYPLPSNEFMVLVLKSKN